MRCQGCSCFPVSLVCPAILPKSDVAKAPSGIPLRTNSRGLGRRLSLRRTAYRVRLVVLHHVPNDRRQWAGQSHQHNLQPAPSLDPTVPCLHPRISRRSTSGTRSAKDKSRHGAALFGDQAALNRLLHPSCGSRASGPSSSPNSPAAEIARSNRSARPTPNCHRPRSRESSPALPPSHSSLAAFRSPTPTLQADRPTTSIAPAASPFPGGRLVPAATSPAISASVAYPAPWPAAVVRGCVSAADV